MKKNPDDILPKVEVEVEVEVIDRISELPNDILISILSLLTFREATTTKILSTRWSRLPTNVISFDYEIDDTAPQQSAYHYISTINGALDSYEGGLGQQRIDKFKIDIPSVWEADSYCERWIQFALSRDTDSIDIRMIYHPKLQITYIYCFSSFLDKFSTLRLRGLKYLKELSLSGVYATDYGAILATLVSLERLSIESPRPGTGRGDHEIRLQDSDCGRNFCKLKHLNISNFGGGIANVCLHELMNLVSLRIHGLESYRLHIGNIPKLVHVSIVKARFHDRKSGFLSGYPYYVFVYAQLLRLRLYIDLVLDHEPSNVGKYYVSPNFTQLKHMELDVAIDGECSNHQLFSWIKTCPSMEELHIKFLWPSEVSYQYRKLDKDLIERRAQIDKLQTLRLSGYRGSVSELEFVLYVVKNATNLKDLIVVEDRHENHAAATPPKNKCINRASKLLHSLIPTSVNFVSV